MDERNFLNSCENKRNFSENESGLNDPVVQRFLERTAAREAHLANCSASVPSGGAAPLVSNVVTVKTGYTAPTPLATAMVHSTPSAPPSASITTPTVTPIQVAVPSCVTPGATVSDESKLVSVDLPLHEATANVVSPSGVEEAVSHGESELDTVDDPVAGVEDSCPMDT